jgi:hypothetical protein
MHPQVMHALEEIDAQLYSGENSESELKTIENYVESWIRRIAELRTLQD